METPVDPTSIPAEAQLQAEIASLRTELALLKQHQVEVREKARLEGETGGQLEIILNRAADGITVQNTQFELTFANKAAAELLGFASPAELLATPLSQVLEKFEVLDEAGRPFPFERFPGRRVLAGEAHPQEIIRFRIRATGQERWSLLHATPVYSQENQIYAVVNVFQDVTALKEVEESLRVQREQFEVTLSSIGDAVIATDTEGRVSYMNWVASTLTGWDRDAAIGQPLAEVFKIINEYTRLTVPNPVAKVLRNGVVSGLANHTLLLARDGREIPIDDSAAPIRLQHGEIRGVVLVFRDVTERKRVEERDQFLSKASQFLASSLDYETTIQNVAALSVPLLADWCTVHLVEEGPDNGFGIGRPQQVALAHKDLEKVEWVKQLQKGLEERYPYDPQASTGLPKVLRTGQAELYPDIPDEFLVSLGVDEYLLQLLRDFGFSSTMIVPLISRERVLGAIQFTSTRESKRHYTEADLAFAQNLADRAALAVDNARLYREARKAIERLEEIDLLKTRFMSIASHELRTPLTSLKGYTQLLARQAIFRLDPGMHQEDIKAKVLTLLENGFNHFSIRSILENIINQTNRMNKLIEEMTDVSRIQGGKLELKVMPGLNLAKLVRRVVEQQQVAHPDRTIKLVQIPVPEEDLTGNYDEGRLEQVLHNFINNALKYSEGEKPVLVGIEPGPFAPGLKGEVNLALAEQSQLQSQLTDTSANIPEDRRTVVVWVKDEGIGIPEEEQPYIFESFFRARSGREHVADGLGLGLFISQQIVNLHGGQVGFKSHIGSGSIFYFWLPLNLNN